ncbi:MAG: DUF2779 domain-containing protein [Sandaracinaceae bacterium]|nr:DUF2779 domain-containing protein [Sandaracinaceae bacterium]
MPNPARKALFERGHVVGDLARSYVPDGILIGGPPLTLEERVRETRDAIDRGAQVIYEASFLEDGVFVAVDILERNADGYSLMEVKSTLSVKDQHIPDIAVQLHVLERAGLKVMRAELMHLNKACRYPNLTNLFLREDVTNAARAWCADLSDRIRDLRLTLSGELPSVPVGSHCDEPYECAFKDRCWPPMPEHSVMTLFGIRKKKASELVSSGCPTIHDLPASYKSTGAVARQIASVKSGELVVEHGLMLALSAFTTPIAFLDFETVMPAIPCWNECSPFDQIPVQFSVHVVDECGLRHHSWLADGAEDPRPALADALILACKNTGTVLAYYASFEKARLHELAKALPTRAAELLEIKSRVEDLHPVVRDYTYHPAYGGSFSIKSVLPALVPGLGYDDLDVADGQAAAALLERVLLDANQLPAAEMLALREALLQYCERDTYGMFKLFCRLRELAGMPQV